jgi:hypothetical protein
MSNQNEVGCSDPAGMKKKQNAGCLSHPAFWKIQLAVSSGLSESVWSGPAAVRWAVERVVAARRGGHPAPPNIGSSCTCLFAGVITWYCLLSIRF